MAEPTLVDVFGTGATQDATTLTITKASLNGLTASATNSAESLLVAILLKAQVLLTETNRSTDFPNRNVTIVNSTPQIVVQNSTNYRRDNITMSLYRLDQNGVLDPDNY